MLGNGVKFLVMSEEKVCSFLVMSEEKMRGNGLKFLVMSEERMCIAASKPSGWYRA